MSGRSRRGGWPLAAAIGLGAVLLALPGAAEPIEIELEEVERALEERREAARGLAEEARQLEAEIADLQARQVAAAAEVQATEAALTELEDERRMLAVRMTARQAALAARREELPRVLAALALLSRDPPKALIAMPATWGEAVRTAAVLGRVLPALDREARMIADELLELPALGEAAAAVETGTAANRERLERQRAGLDSLLAERAALHAEVQRDRERLEAEAAALADRAEDLQELLESLIAKEAARRAEAQELLAAVPPPAPQRPEIAVAGTIAAMPPPAVLPAPTRGALLMPAAGPMVESFGQRRATTGAESRGIVIETREDATVVAPFHGQVAFAGAFRGYGQLLILEHSEGYHTLLAGFHRIDCVVGQWLRTGEPVGIMGKRGSDIGPRLYVELRRNGQPVDPVPWLTAGNGR